MNTTSGPSSPIPRIAALEARFRHIGEMTMRDLPLYNPSLVVEAVGFGVHEDGWIGILITPWFMNLIRLPQAPAPMQMAAIGRKVKVALPSGERELMQGGDEVIGAYQSLSLHSPMFAFETREAARQEAEQRLADLMRPSQASPPEENGRLRVEAQGISRRDLLRGATSNTRQNSHATGKTL